MSNCKRYSFLSFQVKFQNQILLLLTIIRIPFNKLITVQLLQLLQYRSTIQVKNISINELIKLVNMDEQCIYSIVINTVQHRRIATIFK